jgi:hypothetical protein
MKSILDKLDDIIIWALKSRDFFSLTEDGRNEDEWELRKTRNVRRIWYEAADLKRERKTEKKQAKKIRELREASSWQLAMKWSGQSYTHNGLYLANNLNELRGFISRASRKKCSLADRHLDFHFVTLSRGNSWATPKLYLSKESLNNKLVLFEDANLW